MCRDLAELAVHTPGLCILTLRPSQMFPISTECIKPQ